MAAGRAISREPRPIDEAFALASGLVARRNLRRRGRARHAGEQENCGDQGPHRVPPARPLASERGDVGGDVFRVASAQSHLWHFRMRIEQEERDPLRAEPGRLRDAGKRRSIGARLLLIGRHDVARRTPTLRQHVPPWPRRPRPARRREPMPSRRDLQPSDSWSHHRASTSISRSTPASTLNSRL